MNELKVGLFALATMVAIIYMSIKVTSTQSGFGDYIGYRTIVDDASGIFPKTSIRVAGINAGRIIDIKLQGNQALIDFQVLAKVKVTKGSTLRIKTVGFLGDKYLEILVNRDTNERIPALELIQSEAKGGLENLAKDVEEVLRDIKEITKAFKKALAPVDNKAPLREIVLGIQETVENTRKLTNSFKRAFSDNEEKVDNIINSFESFAKRLNEQMDDANKGSTLAEVTSILDNIKKTTEDLRSIVTDLRSGKGTMGKLLVEEEIADEVRETLSGVKKIVSRVEAVRTELSLFTGVDVENGSKTDVEITVFPSPERFYMLGLVTSEIGPTREKETVTTLNGGASNTEVQKVTEKNTYRFNIQLGRKIHNWSFRGGLIESSGGVGVDYDFTNIGTMLTAEVFDYRKNVGVNLRLSSEIHLWNVLYGRISGEDLADDARSFIFSGGLRFTDEDLKGLLGFFF